MNSFSRPLIRRTFWSATTIALCLLLLSKSLCAESYDGSWWVALNEQQKIGFVAGYLDCYVYDIKGTDRYGASMAAYKENIDKFYKEDSENEAEFIYRVLQKFRDRSQVRFKSDQNTKNNPHGFFNGTYWAQINAIAGKEISIKFIDGYLYCIGIFDEKRAKSYKSSPEAYANRITSWYKLDVSTGDRDPDRDAISIGEALERVNIE